MRVFIGVAFSEEIKSYLGMVKDIVVSGSEKGRFTETGLFHLTLKFLGEVAESELDNIRAAMDEAALRHDPFRVRFSALGQFPSGSRKIIWIGLEKSVELGRLVSDLEDILGEIGYPREGRPYVPHITFGRQVALRRPLQELGASGGIVAPEVPVASITLFHSTRIDGELRYIGIHTSPLGNGDQGRV